MDAAKQSFSRLQATSAANIPVVQTAELEDWSDDEHGQVAWDELDDETTKAMIREKRREMRRQRNEQQQYQHKLKQAQLQSGFAERIGQPARKHWVVWLVDMNNECICFCTFRLNLILLFSA